MCGLSTGHAAILPLGCGVLKVRAISSGFAWLEPHLHPRSPCQLASDEILPRSVLGIHAVFSFRTRKCQTTAPCQKNLRGYGLGRIYFYVLSFSLCQVCDPETLQSVRSGYSRNLARLVLLPPPTSLWRASRRACRRHCGGPPQQHTHRPFPRLHSPCSLFLYIYIVCAARSVTLSLFFKHLLVPRSPRKGLAALSLDLRRLAMSQARVLPLLAR